MEREAKALFTEQMVQEGSYRYGLSLNALSHIGAWQNFIYEYQKDGEAYILRFTPSSHRSERDVQAELNWILDLASHGMSVSVPIVSAEGKWTEVIPANESFYFTAVSFVKAKGERIGYPECLNDTKLYEQMGRITGKMHARSRRFHPESEIRRHNWQDNYYLRTMSDYVPLEQHQVHVQSAALIKEITETLPVSEASFGLIHGDISMGNFLVHGENLTLFDFDEAQYSWYVEDIAIPLYYMVYVYGDDSYEQRISQARLFMNHFLKGYSLESEMDGDWLNQLPLFLRLRELIVYTGMHRSMDMAQLDDWSLEYITQSRARIEKGMPIVNIWN